MMMMIMIIMMMLIMEMGHEPGQSVESTALTENMNLKMIGFDDHDDHHRDHNHIDRSWRISIGDGT